MKSTFINKSHIEGYLYEHDLESKISGENSKNPGTPFIAGSISIATNEDCTNIVPVYFTYVTATTSTGNQNATYTFLKNVIDGAVNTVMGGGKENATKVRIDSAIGLNEFYSDRNGVEELVSTKRNNGGFVHVCDNLTEIENNRNTFECEMVITNVRRIEANEEKGYPEKVIVKGAIFDFRKALLPVEFSATNPNAMDYFENLDASNTNPVFTKVWGRQISETISTKIEEESAFGETYVKEVPVSHKEFLITGASKEPMLWDDESTITVSEFKDKIAERETYLATVKKRQEDYKASKAQANNTIPKKDGFNF